MSNTIELAKSFVPKLDECYRLASLTSVLDGAPELAKQGANANELIIPMMSIRSVVQAVADAVLAVCKERKLTDAKLYTSHWA